MRRESCKSGPDRLSVRYTKPSLLPRIHTYPVTDDRREWGWEEGEVETPDLALGVRESLSCLVVSREAPRRGNTSRQPLPSSLLRSCTQALP